MIIFTQDFSGLGWAKLAQEQGDNAILAYQMAENEDKEDEFNLVGDDYVNKVPIKDILNDHTFLSDSYLIFDSNKLSSLSEKLRLDGHKVFGASEFMSRMEHEREFAIEIARKAGFSIPEYKYFKTIREGQTFLEANPDKAYVFKPDAADRSDLTYVPNNGDPEAANKELFDYMESLKDNSEGVGDYVLQEKKKGVEVNYEIWLYRGQPFFGFVSLESKKKLDNDLGEPVGCAHDIVFTIPLANRGVAKTVGRYVDYLKSSQLFGYTGFVDVNVIISDKEVWFLENCFRFGYNSHPNLFLTLAKDSFGNIMADFIDGKTDNFYDRFREGFGASISLYIDHPRPGLPFDIDEKVEKYFYPYDLYVKGGEYCLAGYDNQVGIITAHDYLPEDASESALEILLPEPPTGTAQLNYPNKAFRSDLAKSNYPSSPIKRFRALEMMKMI